MKPVIFLTSVLVAMTLAGCANTPTVSPSEPHGIVSMQTYTSGRIHPLVVVEIDGVNMLNRSTTATFWLAPGTHTLRVLALIREPTHLPSIPDPDHTGYPEHDLTLEIEEGKHYRIAAKETGPSAIDWEPVLVSVRDL